ncbi:thyrotropin-releasing hormone receptor-like isoform X2 [Linepithema humile]|uniref:thyrotropin-releasing hormone receptor-like isoform X2 n=1 Tax=Linepithema humile TaxID=83485 RepID=UPI0006236966|nr:PREDICTED: thyrotropin-releasing hormone receptor-like isoform X2 [Linepithema humile]
MDVENKTIGLNTIDVTINLDVRQYFLPIFTCLGLLGNCLSVYVLLRPELRCTSISIYMGALAINDTGVLIILLIAWLNVMYITDPIYWFYLLSFQVFFVFLSVWFTAAFTVQRYIATKWPLRYQSLCTMYRAKIVIIVLIGLAISYTISWFSFFSSIDIDVYAQENDTIYKIVYTANKNAENLLLRELILRITDIITHILFALPLIIIIIFSTLIMRNVYKQNNVRRILIKTSDEKTHIFSNKMQIKISEMFIIVSTVLMSLKPIYICSFIGNYYTKISQRGNPHAYEDTWENKNIMEINNYE